MTSRLPWQEALRQSLRRLAEPPRVALLGIGNPLRGDDGVGDWIAYGLRQRLITQPGQAFQVQIFEGGAAPENQTGALRRFAPGLVILVDAVQMDASPGETAWFNWDEIQAEAASTHGISAGMLGYYLTSELGCQVALIGIQPAGNEMDARLSPQVQQAAEIVLSGLAEALGGPLPGQT
jgi:hydrogenase 3 maturation protease